MKTIKVSGEFLESGEYHIKSAVEVEEGENQVDTPSMLASLIRIRNRLIEHTRFTYSFPLVFTEDDKE